MEYAVRTVHGAGDRDSRKGAARKSGEEILGSTPWTYGGAAKWTLE